MQHLTFEELQNQIDELYQDGEYSAALELATEHFERFPEQRHLLYYWRAVMSARTGEGDQALALLQGALEVGIWYGEALLRKSPSLQALQGHPEFERLVELNQALRQTEQEETFPLFTLRPEGRCRAGAEPCPLLLALHANASNAQGSMGFWRPAATAGWLVAAPQSTQAIWRDAYIWDDRQASEREIKRHYASLLEGYAIDTEHTVLAGHSMGGEMAIWLALKGDIPASGFIAVGPGGPFMDAPEEWEPLIQENPSGLRGYIIMGEDDINIPQENVRILAQALDENGIPCVLEEIPTAGHDFVPAYEPALLRALGFMLTSRPPTL